MVLVFNLKLLRFLLNIPLLLWLYLTLKLNHSYYEIWNKGDPRGR